MLFSSMQAGSACVGAVSPCQMSKQSPSANAVRCYWQTQVVNIDPKRAEKLKEINA